MARAIAVEIIGDASSLEKAYAKSARSTKKFESGMEKAGKRGRSAFAGLGKGVGLLTGALGAAGLAGAAKAAFTEMGEGQKVAAQTDAVLKSTGHAANVSAEQIDTLANSILKKSGIDDEAIKSGENLLLTFTNVRNEVGKGNDIFTQSTRIMADMSVALGQDMKSSAIQLGKALNDPIKGVTALQRVGVSFTAAQKDQIKQLVATGHAMDAQKLILRELNKEFGGSAEAAGRTLPGKLNILKQTMLNLGASIAETLTPAITRVVDRMVNWLSNTKNQQAIMNAFKTTVAAVTTGVQILKGAFETLSKVVGGHKNAILALIAAYATFKVLMLASRVAKLAAAFRTLAVAEGAAAGAGGAGGLAGSLTKLIPLLRTAVPLIAMATLGTSAGNITGKRASKFLAGTGKPVPGAPGIFRIGNKFFRATKHGTEEVPAQQVQKIVDANQRRNAPGRRQPPDRPDRPGRRPAPRPRGDININTVHIHGVQNVKQMEQELTKRARARPHTRRDP